MLLRHIARPMLASWFVYDGVQAALHPAEHVAAAREGVSLVSGTLGTRELSESQMTWVVRAHGIATAVAGVFLAFSKLPRTAGLTLAALTVPLAAVNQPFTAKGSERQERTARFVRNVGAAGAALLASADTAGKPSLAWRVSHAKELRAATAAGKAAGKAAKKRVEELVS
jgi:uncharacterized membrane protein YphA (DoxX/SURF4 family)